MILKPMRAWIAALPVAALAGDLPSVAPPGPGMSSPRQFTDSSGVDAKYQRRLREEPAVPSTEVIQGSTDSTPMAVLYLRPGGAVTDTGIPLMGQGSILSDPQGGVWNCTSGGCFSPDGTFFQLQQVPRR